VILVDTGPLVAAAVRNDPHHAACTELLRQRAGELVVPGPVVAETCYMLESRGGPEVEEAFLRLLAAGRLAAVEPIAEDFARMADLVRKYRDLPLGAVDASVVALAERFGVSEVATLDRRHFTVVQPRHADSLTLLP
jgi:predicted nucleic acid-binding protein